jgi:hypothetical protein
MRFFFALLLMVFVALPVTAQINIQKKSEPNITNKYIVDPNKKTLPPATTRNNETPDQKATRAYALHALSALCAQNFMTRYRDVNWTPVERSSFWKTYQNGCKCISGEILSVAEPAEVIDFARYTYADQYSAEGTQLNMTRIDAISNLYVSPALRGKCGLPK